MNVYKVKDYYFKSYEDAKEYKEGERVRDFSTLLRK